MSRERRRRRGDNRGSAQETAQPPETVCRRDRRGSAQETAQLPETVCRRDRPRITVKEAAELIGGDVKISTVYKLLRRGDIAHVKVGRRVLPLAASVRAYIRRNTRPARRLAEPPPRGPKVYRHMDI